MSALDDTPDQLRAREAILATLDPDAENQRWYPCMGCGWPCINPIGTVPERRERCLDCAVEQATLGEF